MQPIPGSSFFTRGWAAPRCGVTFRGGYARPRAAPGSCTTASATGARRRGHVPGAPAICIRRRAPSCRGSSTGCFRPKRLRGIVTIAAHTFVENVTLEGIRQARTAYAAGKLGALTRYHGEKTDDVFQGWADAWLDPSFALWNIEPLLPCIDAPVLAVQGEADQYGTPLQVRSIVQQCGGPGLPVFLPDCGHSPHRECDDALLEASSGFVRAIVQGRYLAPR